MKPFPFLSTHQSIVVLRISLAFIFLAHAGVRIINATINQFGAFLDTKGLIAGVPIVWCITVFEIAGGLALAAGYWVKWLTAGFIILLVAGIIIIHWQLGWFVGEHGSGGSEYSFILIIGLIVVAAFDNKKQLA
jgi:putative oxidoreductase